jgi:hypothetical protein
LEFIRAGQNRILNKIGAFMLSEDKIGGKKQFPFKTGAAVLSQGVGSK